jgi:hypothetical protein
MPELDQDEEEAFEDLVQAFRAELEHPEDFAQGPDELNCFLDEFVREDEFTCHGCNLILHRSVLSDEEHTLCRSCSAKSRVTSGQ